MIQSSTLKIKGKNKIKKTFNVFSYFQVKWLFVFSGKKTVVYIKKKSSRLRKVSGGNWERRFEDNLSVYLVPITVQFTLNATA